MEPILTAHLKTYLHHPVQASADRRLSSDPNEKLAHDMGFRYVVNPIRGYLSKARVQHEHKAWFVKGRHQQLVWKVASMSLNGYMDWVVAKTMGNLASKAGSVGESSLGAILGRA